MTISTLLQIVIFSACLLPPPSWAGSIHGIKRLKCENREPAQKYQDVLEITEYEKRVQALRSEMRLRSVHGHDIDAYITTSFDEHQNYQIDDDESRLKFITGFSGPVGDAIITSQSAALWTEKSYVDIADQELDCGWSIFVMGDDPTIAMWLSKQIPSDAMVGADPKTTPHQLWVEWERELSHHNFLRLMKVKNLVDIVHEKLYGGPRTHSRHYQIKYLNSTYTGDTWMTKVSNLREYLRSNRFDAMVVTSLTEIAYLLNLRGGDFTYLPVFRSYLIVTQRDVILYVNKNKVSVEAQLTLHYDLKDGNCYGERECVIVKSYHDIWKDLRTHSHSWKRLLLPTLTTLDMGASESIHSAIWSRDIITERISPIVYMRAVKNEVERDGMRRAHLKDAVAMCDTFNYLKERFIAGDHWTEGMLALETDRSRHERPGNQGVSYQTIIAFGPNAARNHYHSKMNSENDAEITNENLLLVDSGGQYLDGTTSMARTIHLGKPTLEHKRAYTKVLQGLIRLSMLVFPDNMKPSEIDTFLRGPLWSSRSDYQHLSGNGIGSYLSVEESPINIAYTTKQEFVFKEGYFFTISPGFYKHNEYGIRLKSVFEVVDTGDKHFTGAKFLAFRIATLVPFETQLIDRTLLSAPEKQWLNQYHSRIRHEVGSELKRLNMMPAFHWLMNHTYQINEYLTEKEYRKNASPQLMTSTPLTFLIFSFIITIKSLL